MRIKDYDRTKAIDYGIKWAYTRNPAYYSFNDIGGDCTNFISQCIFAGSGVMNYSKTNGWYYNSVKDRSPSWSGVEFLHKFLINNKGVGPFAIDSDIDKIEVGDIAQLSFDDNAFTHSLLIIKKYSNDLDNILIATHTNDSLNRPIATYEFEKIRFIHIEGVRNW